MFGDFDDVHYYIPYTSFGAHIKVFEHKGVEGGEKVPASGSKFASAANQRLISRIASVKSSNAQRSQDSWGK